MDCIEQIDLSRRMVGDDALYGRRLQLTLIQADGIHPYLFIDEYVRYTCTTIYIWPCGLLDSTINQAFLSLFLTDWKYQWRVKTCV